jgi:hypothetical protein
MAFSTDTDLQAIVPDILSFGIASFASEHALAQADIERDIRFKWYPKLQLSSEMNPALLTDSQWTKTASYLVLWKYALPKLTNWVEGDRFQNMIDFYKTRYSEELESVLQDGVEYDANDDSVITDEEKQAINHGRLYR